MATVQSPATTGGAFLVAVVAARTGLFCRPRQNTTPWRCTRPRLRIDFPRQWRRFRVRPPPGVLFLLLWSLREPAYFAAKSVRQGHRTALRGGKTENIEKPDPCWRSSGFSKGKIARNRKATVLLKPQKGATVSHLFEESAARIRGRMMQSIILKGAKTQMRKSTDFVCAAIVPVPLGHGRTLYKFEWLSLPCPRICGVAAYSEDCGVRILAGAMTRDGRKHIKAQKKKDHPTEGLSFFVLAIFRF